MMKFLFLIAGTLSSLLSYSGKKLELNPVNINLIILMICWKCSFYLLKRADYVYFVCHTAVILGGFVISLSAYQPIFGFKLKIGAKANHMCWKAYIFHFWIFFFLLIFLFYFFWEKNNKTAKFPMRWITRRQWAKSTKLAHAFGSS